MLHYGNNGAKTSAYVKINETEMPVLNTAGLEAIGKHRQTKGPGKCPALLPFDSKTYHFTFREAERAVTRSLPKSYETSEP